MSIRVILIEIAVFSAICTAIVFFAASGGRKHSPAAVHLIYRRNTLKPMSGLT